MNELQNFYSDVLTSFTTEVTDKVFLHIQSNPELMKQYRSLGNVNSLQQVNAGLGKEIRAYFVLENLGRENAPQSILIDSYEKHTRENV